MAKGSKSKKIIIAVIAAVVLLGGAVAAYFLLSNSGDQQDQASSQTGEQSTAESAQASINDLLARSENATCTFTYTDPDGTASSGTVYVASGERMRGDFSTSTTDQGQVESGLIQTEDMIYVWDKASNSGISYNKGAFDTTAQEGQDQPQDQQESVDRDQKYDFNCQEWDVDDSQFTPPEEVTFTNYDQQLQQAQDLGQQADGIRQQACAQIADESQRSACENAL